MKKFQENWKKFKANLGDAMMELFLYALFIGIGCGVFALFGKFDALENIDGDTLFLVGILALVVVTTLVCKIIQFFKKK